MEARRIIQFNDMMNVADKPWVLAARASNGGCGGLGMDFRMPAFINMLPPRRPGVSAGG